MWEMERKLEFLSKYRESTRKVLKVVFDASEPIENSKGKDLCEFSKKEIESFLSKSVASRITSTNTMQNYFVAVDQYITWCVDNGYCTSNPLDNAMALDIDMSKAYKKNLFASPEDLSMTINEYLPPLEAMSINNMTRLFLWLAWCGLSDQQALSLPHDAIDVISGEIYFDQSVAKIPKVALRDIIFALKMDGYEQVIGRGNTTFPFFDNSLAVKAQSLSSSYVINWRLSKINDKKSRKLSAKGARKSGQYWRFFEEEKGGTNVVKKYELSRTAAREYGIWKEVFHRGGRRS